MKEVKYLCDKISFLSNPLQKKRTLPVKSCYLYYDEKLNPYLVTSRVEGNYLNISLHDSSLKTINTTQIPANSEFYYIKYYDYIYAMTSSNSSILVDPKTSKIYNVPFKDFGIASCNFITSESRDLIDGRVVSGCNDEVFIPPNTIYTRCKDWNTYDDVFIAIIEDSRENYLITYNLKSHEETMRVKFNVELDEVIKFFKSSEGVILRYPHLNELYFVDLDGNITKIINEINDVKIDFTLQNYYVQIGDDHKIVIYDLLRNEKYFISYDMLGIQPKPYFDDNMLFRNKNTCILKSGIVFKVENDEISITTLHNSDIFRKINRLLVLEFYSIIDDNAIFIHEKGLLIVDTKKMKFSIIYTNFNMMCPYFSEKGIVSCDDLPPAIDLSLSLMTLR